MSELTRKVEGRGLDVGFLCQGWPPDQGGVESHAQDLARALATRGHRVHVLALDYGDVAPFTVAKSEQDGVSIRRFAYRYHDQRALADLAVNARAEDAIAAWLAETPCDVVHVHHLTGWGLRALRAIVDLGQPLAMTLHDYWPLCPRGQMLRWSSELARAPICERPEPAACGACIAATWPHLMPSREGELRDPLGRALDKSAAGDAAAAEARTRFALEMLALPQRLFAPSAAARAVYAAAGVPAQRIRVVENGVEVGALAADVQRERAARARGDGLVHLGVLGSALPSKGVLELAEAFVEAAVPSLVLDVHGALPAYHGDARCIDALKALAAREPRIRLHGPYARGELARILAGLDGVAAPSRWQEVFGLTVREARAAGLPVLVSDRGDLARVADEGRAGIVVPADDRAAWVAALRTFAGDAAARARWAAHASALRDVDSMMRELEREYVAAIVEVTGRMPSLVHPLDAQQPAVAAAPPKQKKGLFGRLFGG
ncbi:MAG: glycosyltransferase [Planctomycetota bacterium]|nr:MAG: glycosyltransferase [Planctomycetota bacterium]